MRIRKAARSTAFRNPLASFVGGGGEGDSSLSTQRVGRQAYEVPDAPVVRRSAETLDEQGDKPMYLPCERDDCCCAVGILEKARRQTAKSRCGINLGSAEAHAARECLFVR